MDKNMSALLDENACTIHVRYQHDDLVQGTSYTYVCQDKSVKPGDLVLVPTSNRQPKDWTKEFTGSVYPNRITVAIVQSVDEDVQIEPNCDVKFFWVIGKVDLAAYDALMLRNKGVEDVLQEAYKHNMRRSFAAQALAGLPEAVQLQITSSLTKKSDE